MAEAFPVSPLLTIFHNYAFNPIVTVAYASIKGIQEIVQHHKKEEYDPHFNETMTILLMVSNCFDLMKNRIEIRFQSIMILTLNLRVSTNVKVLQ